MGWKVCGGSANDKCLVMRFVPTSIEGAFLIKLDLIEDHRGFFARTFCRDEFITHGLESDLAQCSISFNKQRGTLRGMHYQSAPHEEVKLVRCTRGAIFDVILDVRANSTSFKRWETFSLTEDNGQLLYIPRGVAHGFQTLVDNTEVFYQMSNYYHPESACGLRWNDPAFSIAWPLSSPIMSDKDYDYPLWSGE